jgi:hypothetical protein
MTPSLVTALYILRAIVGVIWPVLALAAWPAAAGNAQHLSHRPDGDRAAKAANRTQSAR